MVKRNRPLQFALILVAVYFSQIYPHVHFHHSHDCDGLPVEISFHPIDIDAEHLPEHHGHDDQHNENNDLSKWYVTRTYNQRFAYQLENVSIPFASQTIINIKTYEPFYLLEEIPIVQDYYFFQEDPRGPPIVS